MFVLLVFLQTNIFYLLAVLLVILKNKRFKSFFINSVSIEQESINSLKLILIVFYISVLLFSFLAIKLFEFRWVIPILIVTTWYVLNLLTKTKKEVAQIILTIFYLFFTLWILKTINYF